jgi:hypothetical protein
LAFKNNPLSAVTKLASTVSVTVILPVTLMPVFVKTATLLVPSTPTVTLEFALATSTLLVPLKIVLLDTLIPVK